MSLPKPNPYVIKRIDLVVGDTTGIPLSGSSGIANKPHKELQENIEYLDSRIDSISGSSDTHSNSNPATHAAGSIRKKHLDGSADNTSLGDLVNGGNADVLHTHTATPAPASVVAIRDIYRNLIIKNNSTYPDFRMDISFDECILQNTTGASLRLSSQSYLLNISISGLDGLDTGAEAISTWYYIWIISNGTTHGSLFSTSSTSPVMPTGYTYKALVGAIYNNASSNFIRIYQKDEKVGTTETQILVNGQSITPVALSLTTIIPTTAKKINGSLYVKSNTIWLNICYLYAYYLSNLIDVVNYRVYGSYGQEGGSSSFSILNINQEIYYSVNVQLPRLEVWVSGWTY